MGDLEAYTDLLLSFDMKVSSMVNDNNKHVIARAYNHVINFGYKPEEIHGSSVGTIILKTYKHFTKPGNIEKKTKEIEKLWKILFLDPFSQDIEKLRFENTVLKRENAMMLQHIRDSPDGPMFLKYKEWATGRTKFAD